MGDTTARKDPGAGIDPSRALSLVEAAEVVGVPAKEIQRRMADGTLLFETQRKAGRDIQVIRMMDLFDAFPGLRPPADDPAPEATEPDSAGTDSVRADSAGSEAAAAVDVAQGSGQDSVADAVRSSGADRNALIELCQDLETRLDLAERERQASTASLLMAQRRVLDLERSEGRRPLQRVAATLLLAMGAALVFLAFRLPGAVRSAAADEVQRGLEVAEERAAGREAARAKELRASLDQSLAGSMATFTASLDQALRQASEEGRGLLASEREAQAAELQKLKDDLEAARLLRDRVRAEEREREGAQAQAERAAEVDGTRAALAAVAAAVDERLLAAEQMAEAASAALMAEQQRSEDERKGFEERLRLLIAEHRQALDQAVETAASAAVEVTAEKSEATTKSETPAPWWKRAFGDG